VPIARFVLVSKLLMPEIELQFREKSLWRDYLVTEFQWITVYFKKLTAFKLLKSLTLLVESWNNFYIPKIPSLALPCAT
jgi:hypothetical protein